jgi:hypothetical protein
MPPAPGQEEPLKRLGKIVNSLLANQDCEYRNCEFIIECCNKVSAPGPVCIVFKVTRLTCF